MRPTSVPRLAAAQSILILTLVSCAPGYYSNGAGRTYLGFTLGIDSAPPPPRLQFRGEPHSDMLEDSDVQVVEAPDPDCDLFQYGGVFYLYSAGYWYRGDRYDGPYRAIEVHHVPRKVLMVPDSHWRHRPAHDQGDRDDHGDRGHDRH